MLCLQRISHHPEVIVYLLQIFMFVLFNTGRTNYSLDKFHIHCQHFNNIQIERLYEYSA